MTSVIKELIIIHMLKYKEKPKKEDILQNFKNIIVKKI